MSLNVLLGYDGSQRARQALVYVAPLLRAAGGKLTILTVGRKRALAAELFEDARRALDLPNVEHEAASGSLYSSLVRFATVTSYDVIAYMPPQRGWRRRRHLSRAAALPSSFLLLQGRLAPIERVLLCTAGDDTVVADARLSAELIRGIGARAEILHTISQVSPAIGRLTSRERITEALAATGTPEIQHMQAAAGVLQAAGVEAEIKVRVGPIVDEIVAELEEGSFDLLVIGAHRARGFVERLLLQDVAADILLRSPVPVLVVK
jgi:nucleotide-binding universal stress UspA family protein